MPPDTAEALERPPTRHEAQRAMNRAARRSPPAVPADPRAAVRVRIRALSHARPLVPFDLAQLGSATVSARAIANEMVQQGELLAAKVRSPHGGYGSRVFYPPAGAEALERFWQATGAEVKRLRAAPQPTLVEE